MTRIKSYIYISFYFKLAINAVEKYFQILVFIVISFTWQKILKLKFGLLRLSYIKINIIQGYPNDLVKLFQAYNLSESFVILIFYNSSRLQRLQKFQIT